MIQIGYSELNLYDVTMQMSHRPPYTYLDLLYLCIQCRCCTFLDLPLLVCAISLMCHLSTALTVYRPRYHDMLHFIFLLYYVLIDLSYLVACDILNFQINRVYLSHVNRNLLLPNCVYQYPIFHLLFVCALLAHFQLAYKPLCT